MTSINCTTTVRKAPRLSESLTISNNFSSFLGNWIYVGISNSAMAKHTLFTIKQTDDHDTPNKCAAVLYSTFVAKHHNTVSNLLFHRNGIPEPCCLSFNNWVWLHAQVVKCHFSYSKILIPIMCSKSMLNNKNTVPLCCSIYMAGLGEANFSRSGHGKNCQCYGTNLRSPFRSSNCSSSHQSCFLEIFSFDCNYALVRIIVLYLEFPQLDDTVRQVVSILLA